MAEHDDASDQQKTLTLDVGAERGHVRTAMTAPSPWRGHQQSQPSGPILSTSF